MHTPAVGVRRHCGQCTTRKSRQTFWPGDADRGALRTSPVLGTVSSGSRIGIVRAEAGIRVESSGFLRVAAPHIFLSKTSPMANKSHASFWRFGIAFVLLWAENKGRIKGRINSGIENH